MLPSFSLKTINILNITKRFAGHSKWANIKHTKSEKDTQRSQLFVKLCQRIRVAIQDGKSANPDTNLYLAQAIEIAKKSNMPVASIQQCIKTSQMDKSKMQVNWYEVRGMKGSLLIVSTLTENPTKTKNLISQVLKKTCGTLSSNSSKHLFEHKAVITAKPPDDIQNIKEATVDHAIECGAEEVAPSDYENYFDFICPIEQINQVKGKLMKINYEIKTADFDFIPINRVELTEDDLEQMSKTMDRLETVPEVIKIYDNIM